MVVMIKKIIFEADLLRLCFLMNFDCSTTRLRRSSAVYSMKM